MTEPTAEEFLASLEADEEYTARVAAQDALVEARVEANLRAEAPVLKALEALSVRVASLGDLLAGGLQNSAAPAFVTVVREQLPELTNCDIRETVLRVLADLGSTAVAAEAFAIASQEYDRAKGSSSCSPAVTWAAANAMSSLATNADAPLLLRCLRETHSEEVADILILGLANASGRYRREAIDYLRKTLSTEKLRRTALEVVLALKATEVLPVLEQLEQRLTGSDRRVVQQAKRRLEGLGDQV